MRTAGALGKKTIERMVTANSIVTQLNGKLIETGLTEEAETEVFDFFKTNALNLTLSPNAVLKIAELRTAFPESWQQVVKVQVKREKKGTKHGKATVKRGKKQHTTAVAA